MKTSIAAMVVAAEEFVAAHADARRRDRVPAHQRRGRPVASTARAQVVRLAAPSAASGSTTASSASRRRSSRLGDMIKNGRRGTLSGKLRDQRRAGPHRLPAPGEQPDPPRRAGARRAGRRSRWDDGNAHFPPTTWQMSNIHAGTGAGNVIPGEIVVDFNFRFSTESTPESLQRAARGGRSSATASTHEIAWTLGGEPFLTPPGALSDALRRSDPRARRRRRPSCRPPAARRTAASSRGSAAGGRVRRRSTRASTRSTSASTSRASTSLKDVYRGVARAAVAGDDAGRAGRRAGARLKRAGVSFGHGTGNAFDEAAWLVTGRSACRSTRSRRRASATSPPTSSAKAEALIARRIETPPARRLPDRRGLAAGRAVHDRRARDRAALATSPSCSSTPRRPARSTPGSRDRTRRVLDLCTGNGSLAVLAAMAYPEIAVDAADISRRRARGGPHQRRPARARRPHRACIESDLFAALPGRYDLILCNPPYVNDAQHGRAAAPSTAPSRRWRWPAAPTAWTWCAASSPRRRAHLSDDARARARDRPRARPLRAAFPRLECAWLETSAGDDQVVLIERRALRRLRARTPAGPASPSASAPGRRKSPMLVLTQLSLRRGVKLVLDRASVTLQPGEKVGLVGRNGAGKSSLFSLLRRPPAGRRRRRRDAAALAHRRGRAGDARDRRGRDRLRARGRHARSPRPRPSSPRPKRATTATRWPTRTTRSARPAASTRGRARRRCCSAWASRAPSSTRR